MTALHVNSEVKKIGLWSGRGVYCTIVSTGVALRNGAGFSHVAMFSGLPYILVVAGAPFLAPGSEQITFCIPDFPWASLRHSWVSTLTHTRTRAALPRETLYHFLSLFLSNLGENTNTGIMNYFRTHLLLSILLLTSIRTAVGKVCLVLKLRRRTHAVSFVRLRK